MAINNDSTLLIKLPVELKAMFKALSEARGVPVSESIRRYMRDEISSSLDKPLKIPDNKNPVPVSTIRCKDTVDMFSNSNKGSNPDNLLYTTKDFNKNKK